MSVPQSETIRRRAEGIFKDLLPDGWLPRPQSPDFHNDYDVEVVEEHLETGLRFDVQLKGTRSANPRRGVINHRMETRHLVYYLDRARQAVFLVLIDLETRAGHWLFLQEWLKSLPHGKNWREQKSLTIPIPVSNSLADSEALADAVMQADKYMREMHPGSIRAAITAERARLEEIDSRFSTHIDVVSGTTVVELRAKEDVGLQLLPKETSIEEFSEKIRRLVHEGRPAEFRLEDVAFVGSPLLDDIATKASSGSIVVQPVKRLDFIIRVAAIDRQNGRTKKLGMIRGTAMMGLKGLSFQGRMAGSPLAFSSTIGTQNLVQRSGRMEMHVSYGDWVGQRLFQLHRFEVVEQFYLSLKAKNLLTLEGYLADEFLFSAEIDASSFGRGICEEADLFWYVLKCRKIAEKLGMNPVFPALDYFDGKALRNIKFIHGLLQGKEFRIQAEGKRWTVPMKPTKEDVWGALLDDQERRFAVRLADRFEHMSFLGENITMGPLLTEMTEATLVSEKAKLRAQLTKDPSGSITLIWEGHKDSELVVKLAGVGGSG